MNTDKDAIKSVQSIQNASIFMQTLQPVTFTIPGQDRQLAGFTAQNVRDANIAAQWSPDFALQIDSTTKSKTVHPFVLVPVLSAYLKELGSKVSSIEDRLNLIEQKIGLFAGADQLQGVNGQLGSLLSEFTAFSNIFQEITCVGSADASSAPADATQPDSDSVDQSTPDASVTNPSPTDQAVDSSTDSQPVADASVTDSSVDPQPAADASVDPSTADPLVDASTIVDSSSTDPPAVDPSTTNDA